MKKKERKRYERNRKKKVMKEIQRKKYIEN